MVRRHAERVGEVADSALAVEESALDQTHRPRHRRRRASPCRGSRRALRPTSQAGPESRALRRGRGREEHDVLRLRGLHRTRGPAVDPRRPDPRVEGAVEARVAGDARTIAGLGIERGAVLHAASLARARGRERRRRRSRPKTARQTRARPIASCPMGVRYFYGWNVVGATFVMALGSFGLGFYGIAVYVAALQQLHGWSASTVSAPVTVYYVAGALLTAAIASVYERLGPRAVVAAGAIAMAVSVAALGLVARPWQLYPVFLVMSIGWGAMSGAAINIILAPWWERRRGLAVSLAFNGATLGGVLVVPALIVLVGRVGFARALVLAAIVQLVVMLTLSATIMRRG